MARQVLENGVILPAEYSDDWYDDMTSNLTKLDDVIGSDSEKLSSSDVGAAALSNSYNDLDNLPTIPTKTSDLTNDSNFVDTSNPAVASGITSAKVTSYDNHIADTDIHVTTADKATWNTVTSKANDSDVVHKSGNETVGGNKIFTSVNEILRSSGDHKLKITDTRVTPLDPTGSITSNITWQDSTGRLLGTVANVYDSSGNSIMQLYARSFNANDESESHRLRIISNKGGNSYADTDVNFLPSSDNRISLGSFTLRWDKVYATNYYYGANNVEFSTKFVTTDTNQTISESKTFTNTIKSQKEIEFTGSRLAYILPEFSAGYSGLSLCTYGSSGAVKIGSWKVDDNDNTKHVLDTSLGYLNVTTGSVNSVNSVYLNPRNTTDSKLGDSTYKWKEINGLTPSSLSLPSGNVSDVIDISSYITALDGTSNSYTVPANGWISIAVVGTAIAIVSSSWSDSRLRASSGNVSMLYPVLKNETVGISVTGTTLAYARFIPCQGNV